MTNLPASITTRPTMASALAGLLGLFAGPCAIFAACITVVDWYEETTQASWPVASAIVDRADVVVSRRAAQNDTGEQFRLSARVRYEANGQAQTATLGSRTAYSDDEFKAMQAWAALHPKGSHIDVRHDPSRQNRAVFASPEGPFAVDRMHNDLILLAIAAIASAGLLLLARFLIAREARAAPVPYDPQRGGLLLGALFAVPGLAMMASALYGVAHNTASTADALMGMSIALAFVFAGIFVGLPPQYWKWRNVLVALVVTCLALTFDWVAFGPGERHFTGSIGGIGFIPGEMMGRVMFGIFAVVLDICAITIWVTQCRQIFRPDASAPDAAGSQA